MAEVTHVAYGQTQGIKTSGKGRRGGGKEQNQMDALLTYGFSFPKKQLVASQREVASFPPFDELPADLLLLELALHQRLAILVHDWGENTRREG